NWIPDELHILLRVTDRLWSLVLAEFDINNNKIRNIVCEEMKWIGISFCFWQEHNSRIWNVTLLTGDKKLKMLCEFDLTKLFNQQRAILIRQLWNKFYQLYRLLHNIKTTKDIFENKAKEWVEYF
ncbi:9324_t:CDS:1, partial [Gigaspora rosea]